MTTARFWSRGVLAALSLTAILLVATGATGASGTTAPTRPLDVRTSSDHAAPKLDAKLRRLAAAGSAKSAPAALSVPVEIHRTS